MLFFLYRTHVKIDFHLIATKQNSSVLAYHIEGFNKLGVNVRPLNGSMRITDLFKITKPYGEVSLYLVIFDCKFYEPGDKNGDGHFSGIYTTVFYVENNTINWVHSDSGDFSEYSGVFVGNWRKYNSINLKPVIFSFDPIGLYNELPMCKEFYQVCNDCPDEYVVPKDKYVKNGWTNYLTNKKEKWW